MHPFPLRLAAGALLLGGLVVGGAPVPLAAFGCRPALDVTPTPGVGSDIAMEIACSQIRAERQLLVAGLLVSGVAVLALTVPGRRETARVNLPERTVLTSDRP